MLLHTPKLLTHPQLFSLFSVSFSDRNAIAVFSWAGWISERDGGGAGNWNGRRRNRIRTDQTKKKKCILLATPSEKKIVASPQMGGDEMAT
jgi:hypothetical protein